MLSTTEQSQNLKYQAFLRASTHSVWKNPVKIISYFFEGKKIGSSSRDKNAFKNISFPSLNSDQVP